MTKSVRPSLSKHIPRKSILDKQKALIKQLLESPVTEDENYFQKVEMLSKLDSWTMEPARLTASCLSEFDDSKNKPNLK